MKKIIYQCDSCGKNIEDPYTERMKQYCVRIGFDAAGGSWFKPSKRKIKIHLCEKCFNGLNSIAKNT